MGKVITEFVCECCKKTEPWHNVAVVHGSKKVCGNCWAEIKQKVINCFARQNMSPRKITEEIKKISLTFSTIARYLKSWGYNPITKSARNQQRWQDPDHRKKVIPKISQKAQERMQKPEYKKAFANNSPTHKRHRELKITFEKKFGTLSSKTIQGLYDGKGMSFNDIAKPIEACSSTIYGWYKRDFQLKPRIDSERTNYCREKMRLIKIRQFLSVNQIGPVTFAFLEKPLEQFSVLTEKEINQFLFDGYNNQKKFFYSSQNLLVMLAKNGNKQATNIIFENLRFMVWSIANRFYLPGASIEDLLQESFFGLWKAISDYNPSFNNFRSFAELCIRRQVITAIKTATRQKHIPLNYAKFFSQSAYEEKNKPSSKTILDVIADLSSRDPEILLMEYPKKDSNLFNAIKDKDILSELESQVLNGIYVLGMSYQELAKKLKRRVKNIDNANQRAKRKIRKAFTLEDFEI